MKSQQYVVASHTAVVDFVYNKKQKLNVLLADFFLKQHTACHNILETSWDTKFYVPTMRVFSSWLINVTIQLLTNPSAKSITI